MGMERQSGSMDLIPPLYVSRMLNVPLEKVEKVMGYLVLRHASEVQVFMPS